LNKLIPLLAFSILLLVPVGAQNAFATHPDELTCPDTGFGPGELITEATLFDFPPAPYCLFAASDSSNIPCVAPYSPQPLSLTIAIVPISFGCIAAPIPTQLNTLAGQCQNSAVLINNHCVPDPNQQQLMCGEHTEEILGFCVPKLAELCSTGTMIDMGVCTAQAMGSMIGGALMDIDTTALLVASIGTNPIITGLVAVTLAGVAGQAVWFVHRRKKSKNS